MDDTANSQHAEVTRRRRVLNADLSPSEKLVLLTFLEYDAYERGHDLFPSLQRVSWETGYAYSTVRLAVDRLEQLGVLECVGRVASFYGPRGRVARYRYHADHLPSRPKRPSRAGSQRATVEPDRCRPSAPVTNNKSRPSAPVKRPQVPMHERQVPITARQVPTIGDELSYELSYELRKITGADAPGCAKQGKTEEPEEKTEELAEKEDDAPASPAVPVTTPPSPEPIPAFKRYAAIADLAITISLRDDKSDDLGNIAEIFKRLCAQQHLPYGAFITQRAVDAAWAKREKAKRDFWALKKSIGPKSMGTVACAPTPKIATAAVIAAAVAGARR